jgi:hypothetical protein
VEVALARHHENFAAELKKPEPDYSLIARWKAEIKGLEKTIARIVKRLSGGKS